MLKNSRRNCWNAEAGIPTWTGNSGAVRPPGSGDNKYNSYTVMACKLISISFYCRPRFGTKKKSALPALKPQIPSQPVEMTVNSSDTAATNLSLPGCSNEPMSSRDLLSKMKARNRLLGLPGTSTERNDEEFTFRSVNEEESLILDTQAAPLEFATGVDYNSMMDNIRSFVAFRGVNPGQVATTDLLNEFDGKLPARGAPLFRGLLNQLCTFSRDVHNQGIWQLKPEFR